MNSVRCRGISEPGGRLLSHTASEGQAPRVSRGPVSLLPRILQSEGVAGRPQSSDTSARRPGRWEPARGRGTAARGGLGCPGRADGSPRGWPAGLGPGSPPVTTEFWQEEGAQRPLAPRVPWKLSVKHYARGEKEQGCRTVPTGGEDLHASVVLSPRLCLPRNHLCEASVQVSEGKESMRCLETAVNPQLVLLCTSLKSALRDFLIIFLYFYMYSVIAFC